MKTREEAKENRKIFFNETKRIVDLKGGGQTKCGKGGKNCRKNDKLLFPGMRNVSCPIINGCLRLMSITVKR